MKPIAIFVAAVLGLPSFLFADARDMSGNFSLVQDAPILVAEVDPFSMDEDESTVAADDPFLQPVQVEVTDEMRRYDRRYRMLKYHQGFAIAALGLWAGQLITGQILYSQDNFKATWADSNRTRMAHQIFAYTSYSAYSTAMLLAITAPKFDKKQAGRDAVSTHRALAWVHGSTMMLLPWVGLVSARLNSSTNPPSPTVSKAIKTGHLAAGYAGWGALAGAMLTILID